MLKLFWLAATLNAQILGYNFFNPHDPSLQWRTKETENFEIVYNATQSVLAQKVATEAERAHQILVPLLKVKTNQKTVIIISDSTDSSNGSATGFPRPTIEIFPVLPHNSDSIGQYNDWIQEVVLHEYAHILNFEPSSGVVGAVRTILGSIWKPASFLPRWYTEGFAVEMETQFTDGGRGRSLLYEAQARAFFEDKKWGTETIDRINSTAIPTWPRGARPYYFGWLLQHELGKQKGISIHEQLNTSYGGRVPWFINGPMEDIFGSDFEDFLISTYSSHNQKLSLQHEALKNAGVTNGTPLKQKGYFNLSPRVSPDGLKLAAVVSDFNKDQSIVVWTRPNTQTSFTQSGDAKTITTGKDIHQVDWLPDSQTIIFDKQGTWKHHNTYNDLYLVNILTKKEERLTFGERAREAMALDKNNFVYVRLNGDSTQLMQLDRLSKKRQILFSPPPGHRITTEEKNKYTGAPSALMVEKNGQIYSGSKLVATNTTMAMDPTLDKTTDEVIYSRLTSEGYLLEAKKVQANLNYPNLEKLWNFKNYSHGAVTTTTKSDDHYSGLSYLWPQYWFPFLYFVPGGSVISASTSANDPLYFHQYSIDVGYDTRAQKVKETVSYTNSTLPFLIDLYFANDYQYLAGANAVERIMYGMIQTSHFLQSHDNEWRLQPQLTYKMTDYPGYLFTEAGPGIFLSHSNLGTKKDYQISPETGHSVSVGYNYFLPSLGNVSYQSISVLGSLYLSGWILPERNVIKLRAAGWISPPQNTILTGYQQAGGEYGSPFMNQSFLVRGYPYGEFIGNTLYNFGLEYRFPLAYPFGGPGTIPAFTNAWHMALVGDAITLDGGYYEISTTSLRATRVGTFFASAGVELKGDFQFFYFVPLTVKAGYYYSFTKEAYGGSSFFIGLGSSL